MADTLAEAASRDGDGDAADVEPLVVLPAAFTTENEPLRMLQDGDTIDFVRPLQGGHVDFLAAQVKHTRSTAATLRVRLRRPETGFIVTEEKRTVAMLPVPGEIDTMQPDSRSRSQVTQPPLCPNYDAIDIEGQPLEVEFEVTPLMSIRRALRPRGESSFLDAPQLRRRTRRFAIASVQPTTRSEEMRRPTRARAKILGDLI